MPSGYVVGIDLGTTNSTVAYAPLGEETPTVELLPIPQLIDADTIEARPQLPSFLYIAENDPSAPHVDLPWEADAKFIVGEYARGRAAEAPMRVVAAAKSWLCYSRVDRHAVILPWGAPSEVPQVSPVKASQLFLAHLAGAWNAHFPEHPLAEQKIVLTVPASFDASARELTREAAHQAGLPQDLILLEEPQAAVYAWVADRGDGWRRMFKVGDQVLVMDVGGGTTDFTVIRAVDRDGELELERVAVGNHILAGGDNMDLALAHLAAGQFQQEGHNLDAWQSVSLWHACRAAKETIFGPKPPKQYPLSILGRGKKLIGGTVSTKLDAATAAKTLLEGFFPLSGIEKRPVANRASGFREIGLPFESDPVITHHAAAFLAAHGDGPDEPLRPTHILFNGGVFKATAFRERLGEVLANWFPEQAPAELEGNEDLDFAVARGAAFYGLAKEGRGVRIRGGTARSYYIGIETAGLAIPGVPRPLRALCVVPFGMEEGTDCEVPGEPLALVVGEPAHFRFFGSVVRKKDVPGTILDRWDEDELTETDSLETTLEATLDMEENLTPVRFRSHVTELGVLELRCDSTRHPESWKLEFHVRQDAEET